MTPKKKEQRNKTQVPNGFGNPVKRPATPHAMEKQRSSGLDNNANKHQRPILFKFLFGPYPCIQFQDSSPVMYNVNKIK